MIRVLVTGSQGQLGKCIQKNTDKYSGIEMVFTTTSNLNITRPQELALVFENGNFDYCINCAAYTNVEQAEKFPERAFGVNAEGTKNVALACKKAGVILIQISTDYVFDGEKQSAYTIDDTPNPINAYGRSKLKGEKYIREILENYFIIRTSWLYSEFGTNFYKTILKKAKAGEDLFVTDQQRGCPTDANNLAVHILNLVKSRTTKYGLQHFTDGKAMTWYEFAKSILKENGLEDQIRIEKAANYRTFAARPRNSVLE